MDDQMTKKQVIEELTKKLDLSKGKIELFFVGAGRFTTHRVKEFAFDENGLIFTTDVSLSKYPSPHTHKIRWERWNKDVSFDTVESSTRAWSNPNWTGEEAPF